jgi:hypothetical protein
VGMARRTTGHWWQFMEECPSGMPSEY